MAPSPARRSVVQSLKRGRGRPRLPDGVGSSSSRRERDRNRERNRRRNGGSYATPRNRPRNRPTNNSSRRRNGSQSAVSSEYKPREEKAYQEVHPDLDVDAALPLYEAESVDDWEEQEGYQVAAEHGAGYGDHYQPESPVKVSTRLKPQQPLNIDTSVPIPLIVAPDAFTNIYTPSDYGMPDYGFHSPAPDSANEGVVPEYPPATPGELTVDMDQYTPSRPSARRNGSRSTVRRPPPQPKTPKVQPAEAPEPKEKLELPKASYRLLSVPEFGTGAFARKSVERKSEHEGSGAEEEVAISRSEVRDKMVKSGYQMTNVWKRPKHLLRDDGNYYEEDDVGVGVGTATSLKAEYDMDEQDDRWLTDLNELRVSLDMPAIPHEVFELAMTMIEREWCALERRIPRKQPKNSQTHLSSITPSRHLSSGWGPDEMGDGDEEAEDTKCNICDDGECENSNAIVFCDGCDLAVHQDCYGIPHIPEGQYHCRKCMFAPSQVVHCVLCPNTDGAFKQTSNNGWAHLLCAMWIPELSLGNPVYMEPVDGLDKIPKSRWKLSCYICKQKMGACIQCSNKTCYLAFHVTCARKAKLFLKMTKNPNESPPFDPSTLRALCNKHVPPDWRREQDSDRVFEETVEYFRQTFAGVHWDSNPNRAIPMTPGVRQQDYMMTPGANVSPKKGTPSPSKRKRSSPKKPPWKLPSGAPVIPQIIYNEVVDSLRPIRLRDSEDYVADLCKYWALKREARRGAPLIKRFQSQMDTFSSMEVTRKNYATLAQGKEKLERRTQFAEIVLHDMEKLKELTDSVEKREEIKGKLGDMLDKYVTEVYMPEIELMWPIFDEVINLDNACVFKFGLTVIQSRIEDALYTSVDTFYMDLQTMLCSPPKAPEFAVLIPDGLPVSTNSHSPRITAADASTDFTEPHPLATTILEHIKPFVAEAKRAEAEIDFNPANKTLEQIQQHWQEFDKNVSMSLGTVDELPTEVSSSLSNGALTKAPRSPSTSVFESAYHTPQPFLGKSQRPPLMWVNGNPPWHVAPFEPHGLDFSAERITDVDDVSPTAHNPTESAPLSELPAQRMNGISGTADSTELAPPSTTMSIEKRNVLAGIPLSPPSAPYSETKAPPTEIDHGQLPSPARTAANNSSPPEAPAEEDDSPLSSPMDTPSPKRPAAIESATLSPTKTRAPPPLTPRRASARVKSSVT